MKIIIYLLLLTAIISTLCICITKPTMHKSVLVYDSGYIITPNEVVTVEELDIPVISQAAQPEVVQMTANQKIDNQITEQQNRILQYIESDTKPQTTVTKQQTQVATTKQQNPITNNQKSTTQQLVQTQQSYYPDQVSTTQSTQTVDNTQITTQSAPIGNSTKTTNKPSVTTQQTTVPTQQPTRVLTAAEEEIAWNIWRSNLQNQIMRDSKLPTVPNGTVFRFSFSVDRYGKITNLKTWSDAAQYTPYAIQYIAPVIRNYQGRSILNFPLGSSRVTTDVTGAWKISSNALYSTPQDYNDVEKIRR